MQPPPGSISSAYSNRGSVALLDDDLRRLLNRLAGRILHDRGVRLPLRRLLTPVFELDLHRLDLLVVRILKARLEVAGLIRSLFCLKDEDVPTFVCVVTLLRHLETLLERLNIRLDGCLGD